jgi:Xaa-Pro dipeptidase
MLVSIEPGIYREGKGGYRHSDTVLITDDGYLNLTHAPDQLDELVLQV